MPSEFNPDAYRMPIPMALVDIAAGPRQAYGDEQAERMYPGLPKHDWRFVGLLPSGAHVTFHRGITPDQLAGYLRREGVDMDAIVEPGFEKRTA
jgi:hypothetical protein